MNSPVPSGNSSKEASKGGHKEPEKGRAAERQYLTCCTCTHASAPFNDFLRPDNNDACVERGHLFCDKCDWKRVVEPPGTKPEKYNWICCECPGTSSNPYQRFYIPSNASCEKCKHVYCSGCTSGSVFRNKPKVVRGKGKGSKYVPEYQ